MDFVKAMLRHTRSQTPNDWVLRLALVILNSRRRMCRSQKRCISFIIRSDRRSKRNREDRLVIWGYESYDLKFRELLTQLHVIWLVISTIIS